MREKLIAHASLISEFCIEFCSLVVCVDERETTVPCGMFPSWVLLEQRSHLQSAKVPPDFRLNVRVNVDCTNDAETPSKL